MLCQKAIPNQVHDQLYERSLKVGCVVTMRTDKWMWWRKLWINAYLGHRAIIIPCNILIFFMHISLYFVSIHLFLNQLAITAFFSFFLPFLRFSATIASTRAFLKTTKFTDQLQRTQTLLWINYYITYIMQKAAFSFIFINITILIVITDMQC